MSQKRTSVRKSYSSAFVLDKTKLNRMMGILEQKFRDTQLSFEPKFNVTLANGTNRTINNIEDLLRLDNAVRNPVSVLQIVVSTSDQQKQEYDAQLLFLNKFRDNIRLDISSHNTRWANELFAELEEQVERTLQSNFVYRYLKSPHILVQGVPFLLSLCIVVLFIALLFRLLFLTSSNTENSELALLAMEADTIEEKINFLFEIESRKYIAPVIQERSSFDFQLPDIVNWYTLFIVVPILIVIACSVYTVRCCYPRAVFAWGDYEEFYANLVAKRKTLGNVVVISMALGVLSNLFVLAIAQFL